MFHVYLVLFSNNFYSLISCLILWFLSYFFNISYMAFMFYVLYSIYIVLGSNVFVVSADSYSCWVIIFMSYCCELIWGYTLGMLFFREDLWCFAGIQGCCWPGTTQVPFWGGVSVYLKNPYLVASPGLLYCGDGWHLLSGYLSVLPILGTCQSYFSPWSFPSSHGL